MSKLSFIDYVLNSDFKINDNYLEEPLVPMKIDLIKDGCRSIVFQLDKQLGREYKGGIFPFFDSSNSQVCTVCDYIIFSEYKNELFALVIELKKSSRGTLPQIRAGECFVDYVISTVNRINKTNYSIIKRRLKEIEYDTNNHHFFNQNKMRIISFLK